MSTMVPAAGPIDVDGLFNVKGLVALVTGGGTGIGLMMAKALASAGAARVYIVGRRVDVLQQAANTINMPAVVVPLYCDVTSKISLESIVSVVETDVGFLNLLVCNAGVGGPQVKAPGPETTLEEWRDQQMSYDFDEFTNTFKVNSTSVWYTSMAFLKLLDNGNKKGNVQQSSQVVVTSSIGGFNKKAPGGWAYGPSKAAATHISKQLSVVLPTWNIRANCICPGLFPSEMAAPIVAAAGGSMVGGATIPIDKAHVPLGRMGDEIDMAGQILYLASRAGAYCNGNIIVVDGGRLGTFPGTSY
ncbi:Rhamnolipids biosynthesis 3-oxoacyl-reductase [Podospora aff. communis PSN243]|uniref:Rhamnolipids biosynthesis 3-oxoacyl-reductase n=1 Tax=Podospora aff. communis PSN243 TaxID=3040156 RepID=A0AAV9H2E6_9PEZI|nr:Rhamnolipids biosynthesis 3-oxoacyl-reductase [Podospora aff. communis PSN243]